MTGAPPGDPVDARDAGLGHARELGLDQVDARCDARVTVEQVTGCPDGPTTLACRPHRVGPRRPSGRRHRPVAEKCW